MKPIRDKLFDDVDAIIKSLLVAWIDAFGHIEHNIFCKKAAKILKWWTKVEDLKDLTWMHRKKCQVIMSQDQNLFVSYNKEYCFALWCIWPLLHVFSSAEDIKRV